jgi:DNA (cytosine-5)-methyltransferase 1
VLLDLFCGAGGASMGYHRAGFDVVGVDKDPQPRYPFRFIRADVTTLGIPELVAFTGAVAVHASPPCHDHSDLRSRTGKEHGTGWMLADIRERLDAVDLPYVIENVVGAPMRPDLVLCGSMFGLSAEGRVLKRHRVFESNVSLLPQPADRCSGQLIGGVYGTGSGGQNTRGYKFRVPQAKEAMGIDWMLGRELSQAVPPAYTEHLGCQLIIRTEREEAA